MNAALLAASRENSRLQLDFVERSSETDIDLYTTHCRMILNTRTFVASEEHGLIGIAPKAAFADNIVAKAQGWPEPLLLRRSGTDFLFVGECYMHGIMNGECLQREGGCHFEEVGIV
jgi:hypothetical protein